MAEYQERDWAIIIGIAIIVFLGVPVFLVYLLIIVLTIGDAIFENFKAPNYLQIKNDRLVRMIFRHLKVNDDEKKKILKEKQNDMTADNYDLFKKELNEI